jgi:hypothetical protein
VPGQVSSDPLYQGSGEDAGQLLVDGRRCGQLQVGRVYTGQGEDFAEEGEEVRKLGRWFPLQPEASGDQGREEALEADSKPVGQVESRAATSSQVVTGLLGQHGLSSGLRAPRPPADLFAWHSSKASLRKRPAQRKSATRRRRRVPGAVCPGKAGEVASGRRWAMYQALERTKTSRTWTHC